MADPDLIQHYLRRWFRRWRVWFATYLAGFLVLWLAGLAETKLFYVWSIGWVLVWAFWQRGEDFEKLVSRKRDDVEAEDDGSERKNRAEND